MSNLIDYVDEPNFLNIIGTIQDFLYKLGMKPHTGSAKSN
jgi:hypothetical protein